MRSIYLIYKITNKLNNRYYIGAHKTNNINDGYMGSGKLLHEAYNKHGIENFKKEILFTFNNEYDMFKKEKELVDYKDRMSYNLCEGGLGGDRSYTNGFKLSMINRRSYKGRGNPMYGKAGMKDKKHTEETKQQQSNARKKYWDNLSDSEKITRGKSVSGKRNGMYGKKPPNSISIEYQGKVYKSLAEACRETGLSGYHLKKKGKLL